MTRSLSLALAFLLASCGPDEPAPPTWKPIADATNLTPEQATQFEQARAARDALGKQLLETLTAKIEAEGPATAIDVCRKEAPAIAARVAGEHDLRIGRTSWKLRNPDNRAPAWCDALLADRPEEGRFSAASDGTFGVTFPIVLQERCLTCHGNEQQIPPEVRTALDARYPNDTARGFEPGALRGWFWVEVPKRTP
ncbi:MAG: DUF3365 domain-containing protein [Planctomycetes bacterium]|nr:DUF3365 domain-containing protein [Planctomycetota bacterium]